jgi:hypothetical protein
MKSTIALLLMLGLASTVRADGLCHYTADSICFYAGDIISSTPVQCHYGEGIMNAMDMDKAEENAMSYMTVDVNPSHPQGYSRVVAVSVSAVIWVQTVRVNTSNCLATILSHAYQTVIPCVGAVADNTSPPCFLVMKQPKTRSAYCLAML